MEQTSKWKHPPVCSWVVSHLRDAGGVIERGELTRGVQPSLFSLLALIQSEKTKQQITDLYSSKTCKQSQFCPAGVLTQVFHVSWWQARLSCLRPSNTAAGIFWLSNITPCNWLKKTAQNFWMATASVLGTGDWKWIDMVTVASLALSLPLSAVHLSYTWPPPHPLMWIHEREEEVVRWSKAEKEGWGEWKTKLRCDEAYWWKTMLWKPSCSIAIYMIEFTGWVKVIK